MTKAVHVGAVSFLNLALLWSVVTLMPLFAQDSVHAHQTVPAQLVQDVRNVTRKFLDVNKRCAIHAVSPFGCRHFDCRMSQREADIKSSRGLQAIAREWMTGGLYARIWTLLHTAGLVAPSPIEARSRLRKAIASRQVR